MKKKLIYVVVIVLILAFAGYQYAYKSHREIETEKAAFEVTASSLIEEFAADANAASKKYTDKTISITGTITTTDKNNITVNNAIFAQFSDEFVQAEGEITFKGRCIGYDELLEEIKFDQCSITK